MTLLGKTFKGSIKVLRRLHNVLMHQKLETWDYETIKCHCPCIHLLLQSCMCNLFFGKTTKDTLHSPKKYKINFDFALIIFHKNFTGPLIYWDSSGMRKRRRFNFSNYLFICYIGVFFSTSAAAVISKRKIYRQMVNCIFYLFFLILQLQQK